MFETALEVAIRRKTEKYQELREEAQNRGYRVEITQDMVYVELEGPAVTSLYVCFFGVVWAVNVYFLHAVVY